jgi:hypothetical protein
MVRSHEGDRRPRKRDELAALEPTDLFVDHAGSCHSSAAEVTLKPSRPLGRLFVCARLDGRGTMPALEGAFSSAG